MDDAQALRAYAEHQEMRNLAGTTITAARNELIRLQRAIAPTSLLDADHDTLQRWASSMSRTHKPESRYVKISRAHSFYTWAYGEEIIESVPTARIPRPKVQQAIPRPTPVSEIVKALDALDGEERLWVMLAAFAGLRCCEIAQLTREQIVDTAEPPHLRIIGKGGKHRVVFLCADLIDEIRAYPLPTRGWVFKRRDGLPGRPSADSVSQYGNQALHGAGVRETMHQLRHRFGTDVYAASDLLTTAAMLGHSNVNTSRGYAKLNDAKAAAAVQSLRIPDTARRSAHGITPAVSVEADITSPAGAVPA